MFLLREIYSTFRNSYISSVALFAYTRSLHDSFGQTWHKKLDKTIQKNKLEIIQRKHL